MALSTGCQGTARDGRWCRGAPGHDGACYFLMEDRSLERLPSMHAVDLVHDWLAGLTLGELREAGTALMLARNCPELAERAFAEVLGRQGFPEPSRRAAALR